MYNFVKNVVPKSMKESNRRNSEHKEILLTDCIAFQNTHYNEIRKGKDNLD